jgi:octaprenyl-diphosphate synthase
MQLITTNDTDTDETAYLEVIKAKTAHLFAAACRIGAVVADRPETEETALKEYGMNLGIAFQLIDDVLDYTAKQATLGKTVGDDFREGKITLPIVLAFRRGDAAEKAFWRRTLEEMDHQAGDLERAIAILEKRGVLTETVERARQYGARATRALDPFPDSPEKAIFAELVGFCIERAF